MQFQFNSEWGVIPPGTYTEDLKDVPLQFPLGTPIRQRLNTLTNQLFKFNPYTISYRDQYNDAITVDYHGVWMKPRVYLSPVSDNKFYGLNPYLSSPLSNEYSSTSLNNPTRDANNFVYQVGYQTPKLINEVSTVSDNVSLPALAALKSNSDIFRYLTDQYSPTLFIDYQDDAGEVPWDGKVTKPNALSNIQLTRKQVGYRKAVTDLLRNQYTAEGNTDFNYFVTPIYIHQHRTNKAYAISNGRSNPTVTYVSSYRPIVNNYTPLIHGGLNKFISIGYNTNSLVPYSSIAQSYLQNEISTGNDKTWFNQYSPVECLPIRQDKLANGEQALKHNGLLRVNLPSHLEYIGGEVIFGISGYSTDVNHATIVKGDDVKLYSHQATQSVMYSYVQTLDKNINADNINFYKNTTSGNVANYTDKGHVPLTSYHEQGYLRSYPPVMNNGRATALYPPTTQIEFSGLDVSGLVNVKQISWLSNPLSLTNKAGEWYMKSNNDNSDVLTSGNKVDLYPENLIGNKNDIEGVVLRNNAIISSRSNTAVVPWRYMRDSTFNYNKLFKEARCLSNTDINENNQYQTEAMSPFAVDSWGHYQPMHEWSTSKVWMTNIATNYTTQRNTYYTPFEKPFWLSLIDVNGNLPVTKQTNILYRDVKVRTKNGVDISISAGTRIMPESVYPLECRGDYKKFIIEGISFYWNYEGKLVRHIPAVGYTDAMYYSSIQRKSVDEVNTHVMCDFFPLIPINDGKLKKNTDGSWVTEGEVLTGKRIDNDNNFHWFKVPSGTPLRVVNYTIPGFNEIDFSPYHFQSNVRNESTGSILIADVIKRGYQSNGYLTLYFDKYTELTNGDQHRIPMSLSESRRLMKHWVPLNPEVTIHDNTFSNLHFKTNDEGYRELNVMDCFLPQVDHIRWTSGDKPFTVIDNIEYKHLYPTEQIAILEKDFMVMHLNKCIRFYNIENMVTTGKKVVVPFPIPLDKLLTYNFGGMTVKQYPDIVFDNVDDRFTSRGFYDEHYPEKTELELQVESGLKGHYLKNVWRVENQPIFAYMAYNPHREDGRYSNTTMEQGIGYTLRDALQLEHYVIGIYNSTLEKARKAGLDTDTLSVRLTIKRKADEFFNLVAEDVLELTTLKHMKADPTYPNDITVYSFAAKPEWMMMLPYGATYQRGGRYGVIAGNAKAVTERADYFNSEVFDLTINDADNLTAIKLKTTREGFTNSVANTLGLPSFPDGSVLYSTFRLVDGRGRVYHETFNMETTITRPTFYETAFLSQYDLSTSSEWIGKKIDMAIVYPMIKRVGSGTGVGGYQTATQSTKIEIDIISSDARYTLNPTVLGSYTLNLYRDLYQLLFSRKMGWNGYGASDTDFGGKANATYGSQYRWLRFLPTSLTKPVVNETALRRFTEKVTDITWNDILHEDVLLPLHDFNEMPAYIINGDKLVFQSNDNTNIDSTPANTLYQAGVRDVYVLIKISYDDTTYGDLYKRQMDNQYHRYNKPYVTMLPARIMSTAEIQSYFNSLSNGANP